jgi:hypothetical protein
MRGLKIVRYFVLAASLLVITALAACGSSAVTTTSTPIGSGGNTGSGGNVSSDNGSVTGTVTWHDGNPVTNAHVYFENRDMAACINNPGGFTGVGWTEGDNCNYFFQFVKLAADGSYSLPGCPCRDLTAYIDVSAEVNGGPECYIIMRDNNQNDQNYQTYSGFQASPGDVINWQALDMPCSGSWYASDSSAVQSEAALLQSQNSGSWQNAEQETSGGGFGG